MLHAFIYDAMYGQPGSRRGTVRTADRHHEHGTRSLKVFSLQVAARTETRHHHATRSHTHKETLSTTLDCTQAPHVPYLPPLLFAPFTSASTGAVSPRSLAAGSTRMDG